MTFKWLILTGVVKAIFVVAPFVDISGDFNLGDRLEESKEFAAAGSTKAMLFTSPILLALLTLNETTQVCHSGVDAFRIAVAAVVLLLVVLGCYKVPTYLFRGRLAPFVWFVILTAFEIVIEIFLLVPVAKWVCA
jgi:hypothetical protein